MGALDDLLSEFESQQKPQGQQFIQSAVGVPQVQPAAPSQPSQGASLDPSPMSALDALEQEMSQTVSVPGGIHGDITAPQGEEHKPYFGDEYLKPIFGSNPIEDVAKIAGPALDTTSDRPIGERITDTAAFVASAPQQALRLPSIGTGVESLTGYTGWKEAEDRFVENNPGLLRGLGAIGEVAPGLAPTGSPAVAPGRLLPKMPDRGALVKQRMGLNNTPKAQRIIDEDAARVVQEADAQRSVGIEPMGPVLDMARRGDDSAGAVTKVLGDKPIVGAPLQNRAVQFIDETEDAFRRTREDFGPDADIHSAGAQLKSAMDEGRNARDLDLKGMSLDDLQSAASQPVRLSSFRDVQSAKYELAERLMPEGKIGRKAVGEGQTRDMTMPTNTQAVLERIRARKNRTINKTAEARKHSQAKKIDPNAEDVRNPDWTSFRDLNQSLDAIANAKEGWRAGIQGLREVRSMVRRMKASMKGLNEVKTLAKGDLKALEGALVKDIDALFSRVIAAERKAGRADIADQYQASWNAYKEADSFTARYERKVFQPLRQIFHDDITPESAARVIMAAMKDGTKGSFDKITALRRVLPKDEIDNFASAMLKDMAAPLKGAGTAVQDSGFQLSKLVSEWNNLNPNARRLIFGRDKQRYQNLETIIRAASRFKDLERLANNSRTGVSNAVVGAGTIGLYGLSSLSPALVATFIGTGAAGWGASKFLASPTYARWIERSARLKNASPAQRYQHLQRLKNTVSRDPRLSPSEVQPVLIMIERAQKEEMAGGSLNR